MDKTEARFNAKLIASGDCKLWRGAVQTSGFGQIWSGGRNMLVHRYSYELAHGPLPAGTFLVHKCGEKTCVNVDHLQTSDRSRSANPADKVMQLFLKRVNKTDACWNWTGALAAGYGVMRRNGGLIKAHRYSYETSVGPIPEGMMIDHICHNPACVRPDHLRPVTPTQNSENKRQESDNSNTGFRGVYFEPASNKYVGIVTSKGVRRRAGGFATLEEAKTAVIALRNELHTHNDADRRAA